MPRIDMLAHEPAHSSEVCDAVLHGVQQPSHPDRQLPSLTAVGFTRGSTKQTPFKLVPR
jgi:hypothetical protein